MDAMDSNLPVPLRIIGAASVMLPLAAEIGAGAKAADEVLVTLYHGTTRNAASKIARGGFRAGADGAVFFAEDFATAEEFAKNAAAARSATGAVVVRFQVPEAVAARLQRGVIGEFRGLPFADIYGSSGYERILLDDVGGFNNAMRNVTRIKVGNF
jgi:hypothetical protein